MLPRLETRIILVGEASRNDLLIQALKVGYWCTYRFPKVNKTNDASIPF
jgi:hypothetical protein